MVVTESFRADPSGSLGDAPPWLRNASIARIYDYILGGKDNYEVDRAVADKMLAVQPKLPMMARANRRFLFLAVRHVVARLGITQFLDVGAGLPTACSVHEVAQDLDPTARVLYVDNDPQVAAHAHALLRASSTAAGQVVFVTADATDPGSIINHPDVTSTLDLSRPVALLLVSVLMAFPDAVAYSVVSTLLAGLAPGSCVVISHPTGDFAPDVMAEIVAVAHKAGGIRYVPRSRAQVERFFTGLDLVAPGITDLMSWQPTPAVPESATLRPPEVTGPDGLSPAARSVYYWAGLGLRRPTI
jgi:O-methyltransferase involved in polyketide biosynthesis